MPRERIGADFIERATAEDDEPAAPAPPRDQLPRAGEGPAARSGFGT